MGSIYVYENGSNLYRLSTVDDVCAGAEICNGDIVMGVLLLEVSPPQAASKNDRAAIDTRLRFIEHRLLLNTVLTITEFY